MAIQVRRIVTGHDAQGHAVVKIDEISTNITSNRPSSPAGSRWTSARTFASPGKRVQPQVALRGAAGTARRPDPARRA